MKLRFKIITCIGILLFVVNYANGQTNKRMMRIAKVEVDAKQLKAYKAALSEQMQTAIHEEPGVLSYYAVADKKQPTQITIFEIYANQKAYEKHILTPHFKKYKATVEKMVKNLELVDVDLVGSFHQPGIWLSV